MDIVGHHLARPRSFTLIAVLALLWNLAGLAMFAMQAGLTPADIAAMPPGQREVYAATPMVLNLAFAIAVLSGLLGSMALLLRQGWAVPMFLVSLLALVAQFAMAFTMTPVWTAMGPTSAIMPIVLLVIATTLLAYSQKARGRGWIGRRAAQVT